MRVEWGRARAQGGRAREGDDKIGRVGAAGKGEERMR